jgi:hypothetical protein
VVRLGVAGIVAPPYPAGPDAEAVTGLPSVADELETAGAEVGGTKV